MFPRGFRKTNIPYKMFDLERSADEAKRLTKCENIYHRGQEIAWDGNEILAMLREKHGGVHLPPEKAEPLKQIFSIILWGELAAWKISAQLADGLIPLEARMAATSQAFDEARHFYVMHDYLTDIGYTPQPMDRAPEALLDLVLDTKKLAHKLLGMQLLIEPLALTIFQLIRELEVEPVLTELLKYYERDEARHVGLGMQYLPFLMKDMNKRELSSLLTFQCRLLFWAVWEAKVLEEPLRVLGVDARVALERARKKQLAATCAAFEALGWEIDKDRNILTMTLNGSIEYLFPENGSPGPILERVEKMWNAFWQRPQKVSLEELSVHGAHEIQTARGVIAKGEKISA